MIIDDLDLEGIAVNVLGTDEQEALDRKATRTPGALVATVRLPSISSEPRSRTLISHAKPQPLLVLLDRRSRVRHCPRQPFSPGRSASRQGSSTGKAGAP
ncbi:MAG: hypothetical protein ACJ8D8_07510, partial [Microvirga sp.]